VSDFTFYTYFFFYIFEVDRFPGLKRQKRFYLYTVMIPKKHEEIEREPKNQEKTVLQGLQNGECSGFGDMCQVQRRYEGCSVGLGMDEVWFGVLLALSVIAGAFFAWRMEKNAVVLRHEIGISVAKLEAKVLPEFPNFDEVVENLEDLITETIGNMRTPQVADHIGAMAQQWLQFKLAKEMNSLNPATALTHVSDEEPPLP